MCIQLKLTNDSHIDLHSIMPGMINHRSTKDIVNGRLFSLMIAGRYDLHSYFFSIHYAQSCRPDNYGPFHKLSFGTIRKRTPRFF